MYAFARPRFCRSDYLFLERESPGKHEFLEGEILAMAGARPRHNAVSANMITALRSRLGDPCSVLSSDQRVTVESSGSSFYPDVVVVCGDWTLDEDNRGVTNPTVVVEVLSPGTEAYDRLEKLPRYKSVSSLRDAILVDHRARTVEHHRRLDSGQWLVVELSGDAILDLAVGAQVPLGEIFANLERIPE